MPNVTKIIKSSTRKLELSLRSYDIKVEYTPVRSNVAADTLSRPPHQDENLDVSSLTVDILVTNAIEINLK